MLRIRLEMKFLLKRKKQEIKKLQKKLKEAKKKGDMSQEDMLDLEDQIEELKKGV